MKVALIDGDSIAYIAATQETYQYVCRTVDTYMARILSGCETKKYELYIEGWSDNKHNFRNDIAITKPYKGNRTGEKPAFLAQAKQYMVSRWNARVVAGEESEDRVLIRHAERGPSNCIIAGIDKDLKQVKGTFFNYSNETITEVDQSTALLNFATQCLTGDSVDNIPGVPGLGPKKAAAILSSLSDEVTSLDETLQVVAEVYKEHNLPYSYLVEQLTLLYLRREEGEVFKHPLTEEEYNNLLIEEV